MEALYRAGAAGVYVTTSTTSRGAAGGPYADSLIVDPPADPARRAAVLALCRAEAAREGLEWTDADDGGAPILLWWD